MKKISLDGVWRGICFKPSGEIDFSFSGAVPGCAHTDLIGSKLPNDIYYRDNTDECQWIEERDFEYSREFELSELPVNAQIVFEGLDTYADIYLNGTYIASTDDMFIKHTFPIDGILIKGRNTLKVYFHSPVKRVDGLPARSGAFTTERMYTRRIQCTYGWDWVARFVTCGIWRSVYLEAPSGELELVDAYIYTDTVSFNDTLLEDCDEERNVKYATVVVEAEFSGYEKGGYADMSIISPAGETVYSNRFFKKENFLKQYIDILNAELWYPSGYGKQPLYTLVLCGKEYKFGIRTARISELPDKEGSPYYKKCLEIKDSVSGREYDRNEAFSGFQLLINDVPIMCKGANWVPSEPFPSAETEDKITTLLELAKEANLNMLRVWGGGIFEKQHFYSECDRLGILVTQDFLMACGSYPENDSAFIENIKKETEFAARELRNHPSLVWWSGDNENAILGYDESESYSGRTAIFQGIYPVLNRLDPHRRFFLSSPYGGTPYASKTQGTTHNTQYLGCSIFPYIMDEDMADYKEHFSQYLARFIAEEPTTGAICLPSLKRFMTEDDIYNGDEMWNYHIKSNPALPFSLFDVLNSFTQKVLGAFSDGRDRFFKLKYAQYEWVRITLENVRRNSGFCNGIIYWMWNDCWPAAGGWSFVDYYCLPKAAFYSFKRCAGNILASIEKNKSYDIFVCCDNDDSDDDVILPITVSYLQNGVLHHVQNVYEQIYASATPILSIPISTIPENALLICDIGEDRAFYKNGSLNLVPTDAVRIVNQARDSVTVSSDKYVHAVELEGEYVFDDNYFSLLPGEERTIHMRPSSNASSVNLTLTAYTFPDAL